MGGCCWSGCSVVLWRLGWGMRSVGLLGGGSCCRLHGVELCRALQMTHNPAAAHRLRCACTHIRVPHAHHRPPNSNRTLAECVMLGAPVCGHKIHAIGTHGSPQPRLCCAAVRSVPSCQVPGDTSALVPGGLRMGSPALTSRGFVEVGVVRLFVCLCLTHIPLVAVYCDVAVLALDRCKCSRTASCRRCFVGADLPACTHRTAAKPATACRGSACQQHAF